MSHVKLDIFIHGTKYRHEENHWVDQRYHSCIDVTHPDEPRML